MRAIEKKIDNTFYSMCEKITTLRKFAHIIRDKELCPATPTAGVRYGKDSSITLIYNDKFVAKCSTDELRFILAHELTHILLQHLQRYNEHVKEQTPRTCALWNIVSDAYINEFLLTKHFVPDSMIENSVFFNELGKMGVTREEFDNGTCESIYDKLVELNEENENDENEEQDNSQDRQSNSQGQNQQTQNSNSEDSDENDNSNEDNTNNNGDNNEGDSENAVDDKTTNDEVESAPVKSTPINPCKKALNRKIDEAIENDKYSQEMENVKYVDICEGCDDEIAIDRQREIELLEGMTIDWNEKLRKFIDGVGTMSTRVRSSKRVNKRYHEIRPHSKGMYKSSVNNIIVSIDISGSMDEDRINTAVSAINELSKLNSVEFDYTFFHSENTTPKTFGDMETFTRDLREAGSGGTKWIAATEYFTEDYNGAILISDMCFGYGVDVVNDAKELPIDVQLIDVDEIELPA